MTPSERTSLGQIDRATNRWFADVRESQAAAEADRNTESRILESIERSIAEIPAWARLVRGAMPDWGFEPCSHRWLDGLDDVLRMIESEEYHATEAGRCGDTPGSVVLAAERRAAAVERWLHGDPGTKTGKLERQVSGWLGERTPEKEMAARCFVQIVRAHLFQPEEKAQLPTGEWRERQGENEILARLFYGDGLDGGLKNACGYRATKRLDIYLRVIGGDDSQLAETRWVCNTQLRFAPRDDPARIDGTLGYIWGVYAHLADRDADWLRERVPQVAGAALHALRRLSGSSAPEPVRRWLAASLLSTTKFWYRRALSFMAMDDAPAYWKSVPTFPAME